MSRIRTGSRVDQLDGLVHRHGGLGETGDDEVQFSFVIDHVADCKNRGKVGPHQPVHDHPVPFEIQAPAFHGTYVRFETEEGQDRVHLDRGLITGSVVEQTNTTNEISDSVQQANTGTANIATSIAELARGANDVSKSAAEAARGVTEVSSNIQGLSRAANESNTGAQQVKNTAEELARIASQVQVEVLKFKVMDTETTAGGEEATLSDPETEPGAGEAG